MTIECGSVDMISGGSFYEMEETEERGSWNGRTVNRGGKSNPGIQRIGAEFIRPSSEDKIKPIVCDVNGSVRVDIKIDLDGSDSKVSGKASAEVHDDKGNTARIGVERDSDGTHITGSAEAGKNK